MTCVRLTLASITLAGWLAGCTDPGCIRNSECPTEHLCLNSVCVRPIDGGLEQPIEPMTPGPTEDAGIEY